MVQEQVNDVPLVNMIDIAQMICILKLCQAFSFTYVYFSHVVSGDQLNQQAFVNRKSGRSGSNTSDYTGNGKSTLESGHPCRSRRKSTWHALWDWSGRPRVHATRRSFVAWSAGLSTSAAPTAVVCFPHLHQRPLILILIVPVPSHSLCTATRYLSYVSLS